MKLAEKNKAYLVILSVVPPIKYYFGLGSRVPLPQTTYEQLIEAATETAREVVDKQVSTAKNQGVRVRGKSPDINWNRGTGDSRFCIPGKGRPGHPRHQRPRRVQENAHGQRLQWCSEPRTLLRPRSKIAEVIRRLSLARLSQSRVTEDQ
jgi:hypothetical protein